MDLSSRNGAASMALLNPNSIIACFGVIADDLNLSSSLIWYNSGVSDKTIVSIILGSHEADFIF
ncbi:MAG TPA: hypothetical protein VLB80_00900 [Candidatus Babeliales bacterium]|nr:hypothetical protein [Candidatus Babeliales bacterium]